MCLAAPQQRGNKWPSSTKGKGERCPLPQIVPGQRGGGKELMVRVVGPISGPGLTLSWGL